jgi:hypothetical protein
VQRLQAPKEISAKGNSKSVTIENHRNNRVSGVNNMYLHQDAKIELACLLDFISLGRPSNLKIDEMWQEE